MSKRKDAKGTQAPHPRGKRYLVVTAKGKRVLRWEDEL